jgi:mono/diheme cytochrome c family protein
MHSNVLKALSWMALAAALAAPHPAFPQAQLTDQQKLGQRLFEQSCGVCHTRPTLVSAVYGPQLSKDSAGGREDVMRDVITNGTPRMPGFKYTYDSTQIAAIAAYLKIMPVPPPEAPPPAAAGAPRPNN